MMVSEGKAKREDQFYILIKHVVALRQGIFYSSDWFILPDDRIDARGTSRHQGEPAVMIMD